MQFFFRSVSSLVLVIFIATPFLVSAQAKNDIDLVKTCKTKVVPHLSNVKKRGPALKLLPQPFQSALLAFRLQLVGRVLQKKQLANKKVMKDVQKKLEKECEKLKALKTTSNDAIENSQEQRGELMATELIKQIDPASIKAEMGKPYHARSSDRVHAFGFSIAGNQIWLRLLALDVYARLAINCTYGRLILGGKKVDTIPLNKDGTVPNGVKFEYDYNLDGGIEGCPDAKMNVKIFGKNGKTLLGELKNLSTEWTQESYTAE